MNNIIRKAYLDAAIELKNNFPKRNTDIIEVEKYKICQISLINATIKLEGILGEVKEEDEDNIHIFVEEFISKIDTDDIKPAEYENEFDEIFNYCLDRVYDEKVFNDLSKEYIKKYKYDHANSLIEDDYANEYSDDAEISREYDDKDRFCVDYFLEENKKSPDKFGEYVRTVVYKYRS